MQCPRLLLPLSPVKDKVTVCCLLGCSPHSKCPEGSRGWQGQAKAVEILASNRVLRLCVCILLGLPVSLLASGLSEQLQHQSCLRLELPCFCPRHR